MAKIIVRLKQLGTEELLTECLPTRSPGWAKSSRSLLIMQDNGAGVPDGTFVIPSTVGNGQGRRLTSTAHGLSVGQPLRLHVVSGAARFDLAISSTDKSMLATHVVTRVVDADTFDVAQVGAWDIPGLTVGDLYLSDSTAGALTSTPPTAHPAQRIGVYDGTALHLTIAPPGGDALNLDTLVEELDARTDLTAIPKGSAGGDLDGSYADPVVARITGVGAALRSVDTDISYTPETREEADLHANGGRGICPGKHYRTISGVQTEERCWCVSDEYGEAFWSHDYLKSTVKDTSIRTAGPTAYGGTADQVYRWGTRRFVYMGGAINSWAWVTGCGRTTGGSSNGAPGIFYARHEPASYAADGSMLESAWHYLPWTGVDTNGINKSSSHNGTLCWEGDSRYVARTADFSTFQTVADGGSSDYRFAGISNDSYGTWGALSQWGDLWKSVPVAGQEGTAFAKLASINVSYDGGKTFSAAAKLPGGSGVCRWSGLLCCYGLWLAIVFDPGTSGYSYAYSEDFENWIVYSGSTLPAFYDASNDGVRWFATNKMSSEAGAAAIPAVYQLLVDAVNVKRRLNLENGAAVAGPLFLMDTQSAAILGTDENGKAVAKTGAALGLILDNLADVDTTTTSPTDGQVLKYSASSGLWLPGNSGGGGSTTYAKYAPTMDPVLATAQIAIPNGTSDQWAMNGSMLIPPADMSLSVGSSTMAMICPQPASGGHYLYALYEYKADDKSLSLVLSTGINTMPSSSSWLEATITRLISQPIGGTKYYFVMFTDSNSAQFEGVAAATNLNVYPLPGIQKDASFHNFTEAPTTIAFGGYSENTNRFFGRLKA